VARVARGGGTGGLLYASPRDHGDVGVPGEMPAVIRRLGARAYGGGIADPPVRGVRARTAALTPRRLGTGCVGGAGPRDGARLGRRGLGQRGRGRRSKAGGGRRRRRFVLNVLLVPGSKRFFSKFLNRTGPSDEYQSCRSSYQQHFLQRLHRIFLPRFEVI
jgi:hypothetical protein